MALMSVQQWAKENFEEGSRPDARTIRRWVDTGKLDGVYVGGHCFIDSMILCSPAPIKKPAPPVPEGYKLL